MPAHDPATAPSATRRAPSRAAFARIDARLARAAPLLLLTLSLVQGLLACWAAFGVIDGAPSPPRALTAMGRSLYRPDRDMPLYLCGALACIVLITAFVLRFERRRRIDPVARTGSPEGARVAQAALAGVALLPFFVREPALGHGIACVAGLCVVAWCLATRHASSPAAARRADPAPAPSLAPTRRWWSLLADGAIPVVILATLVVVPWSQAILWRSYAHDGFHHFDFYAVAPALAWSHGARLATDFYTQYGVGWPLALAWIARATGALNHTILIRLEVAVGCLYFLLLFQFLRAWLRDRGWATAGMLLALFIGLFLNNEEGLKWLWPSSTPMRYAFDVAFFAALLAHARTADARLGPLVGGLVGLQLLFATDVGLYMLLAFAAYVTCAARRPLAATPRRSTPVFAAGAAVSGVLVALLGFTIANQGALPDRAFWRGWGEALFAYGGGLGHLPIAGELGQSAIVDVLLPAILVAYFLATGLALAACVRRSVSADQAMAATIAVYGMGALLLFIGRSHHYNLLHVAIPACLLATRAAQWGLHAVRRRRVLRLAVPDVLCLALVVLLLDETITTGYPNALDVALGVAQLKAEEPAWRRRSGDVVQPIFPRKTAPFRAASEAIRQASAGGRHSVAVIGIADSTYLLEADVAPWFRYSPVLANLVFLDQVQSLEQQIATTPPEWIFLSSEPEATLHDTTTADVLAPITAFVRQRYAARGRAGPFDVYGRAAAAVAQAPVRP